MKSFYQFLQTYRQPKIVDDITQFAYDAFQDHSFPTHSTDYQEISSYLEMNGHYLKSMTIFDDAWEDYQLSR
ncbi:YozE family protein [Bacillus massiliigorillae]|uniref:YozE family protein n=1 Tax=Bacillus massiliigorillae TaxID=1243664 RepID=UPI0003A51E55|nr:YozE family protein [Bacillus massiliigorillae]